MSLKPTMPPISRTPGRNTNRRQDPYNLPRCREAVGKERQELSTFRLGTTSSPLSDARCIANFPDGSSATQSVRRAVSVIDMLAIGCATSHAYVHYATVRARRKLAQVFLSNLPSIPRFRRRSPALSSLKPLVSGIIL